MSARYPYSRGVRQPLPSPQPEFPTLTVADVQRVERDRVLTELRRRFRAIATTEKDPYKSYGTRDRSADQVKRDVERIVDELESDQ